MVDVKLGYQSGIDRYYGLLEFGEKHGVFQRSGNRYDMNGTQLYGKSIYADPEKYFTEDVMKKLDEAANRSLLMDRWIRTYPKIFDKKECDGS